MICSARSTSARNSGGPFAALRRAILEGLRPIGGMKALRTVVLMGVLSAAIGFLARSARAQSIAVRVHDHRAHSRDCRPRAIRARRRAQGPQQVPRYLPRRHRPDCARHPRRHPDLGIDCRRRPRACRTFGRRGSAASRRRSRSGFRRTGRLPKQQSVCVSAISTSSRSRSSFSARPAAISPRRSITFLRSCASVARCASRSTR